MTNLRQFDDQPAWAELFRSDLGDLRVNAMNAFGVLYCIDPQGFLHEFDPETLEPEASGIDWDEAMKLVRQDPEIIDQGLYEQASERLGPVAEDEMYSLRIEKIIGGKPTFENMSIEKVEDHFRKLASVVSAVRNDPEGTVYGQIRVVRDLK